MGYAGKNLDNGFKATGLNFVSVSGKATTLGDLKVIGYGETYFDAGIMLNKTDEFGGTLDGVMYTWWDFFNEEAGDEGEYWYGWYNDDGECCNSVPLTLGEGVMVQAPNNAFSIQVAGQVYGEAFPITLQNGFTLVGNPVPTALTLGDAKISGYGETYYDAGVMANKLDEFGGTLDGIMWTWWDFFNEEAGDEGEYWYGWYNDDGECCNNIPLAIGEGIFIQAPSSAFSVTFPAAL